MSPDEERSLLGHAALEVQAFERMRRRADFLDNLSILGTVLLVLLAVLALFIGLPAALIIGNQAWECHVYPGGGTRMVAGTCMIQYQGRWVNLDDYTKMKNLNLSMN